MTLSDKFHDLYKRFEENPRVGKKIVNLIEKAPESSERDGLMSLMYHEGIGYPIDLDKSFALAESASDGGDPLGYFMLGFMCDNIETPDQAEGGPRQKYDHYDAERFYAKCAEYDSRWRPYAILWLGDYYMDSARGGDRDIAVEYYESIANDNSEAAEKLSDYYWDLIMPEYFEDDEWRSQLFKWTTVAAKTNPYSYSYRMGWMYADGIGCEKSFSISEEFFKESYQAGNWKAAAAIVKINEEFIEEHPEMTDSEKEKLRVSIQRWNKLSDDMYEEEQS